MMYAHRPTPIRETAQTHRCCCLVTSQDGTIRNRCGMEVPRDQPFCSDCEDRHDKAGAPWFAEHQVLAQMP